MWKKVSDAIILFNSLHKKWIIRYMGCIEVNIMSPEL